MRWTPAGTLSRYVPFEADYEAAGRELSEWFTDEGNLFALSLASRA